MTEPASEVCTIYEYSDKYWIIEQSCQLWPAHEGPTERVALAGSLPQNCTSLEMGELTFQALDRFNSKQPKFRPWQLKELRKDLCSWVGARGWPSFYKNARYVWIARYRPSNVIRIWPVDNCNVHPIESALEKFTIETTADIDAQKFGGLIRSAFLHATSHPERKIKPVKFRVVPTVADTKGSDENTGNA